MSLGWSVSGAYVAVGQSRGLACHSAPLRPEQSVCSVQLLEEEKSQNFEHKDRVFIYL